MNCRETQRRLHAEPFNDRADVGDHIAQCAVCRHVAAELAQLERDILDAALLQRVPEGLSARVLLRQHRLMRKDLIDWAETLFPRLRGHLRRQPSLEEHEDAPPGARQASPARQLCKGQHRN
jgi:hypothetical protein